MRKNKQRLIYLVIFVCLFGLFLIFKNELVNLFQPKTTLLFSKTNQKDIIAITVDYNSQNNYLFIKDQNWYLKKDNQDYPANMEKVNKIITGFLNLKKEEIVASNKNRHSDMGIEKNKIVVKTKNQTVTVYIGKPAGPNSSYIRINQEGQVFLSNELTAELLSGDFQNQVENKK